LGLLNKKGTFCFITSNSWLDVDYGIELQEFLCKYVPIIAIFDNPKRSFVHGDVNTIIALFGHPDAKQRNLGAWIDGMNGGGEKTWPGIQHAAKFVMFKKPFEEVLSTKNMIEIENAKAEIKGNNITDLIKNVLKSDDFRIFPIMQEDLLNIGWKYEEGYDENNGRFKTGFYEGDKWGGKYLRASELLIELFRKNCIDAILNNYGKIITVAWSREGKNKDVISKIENSKKGALLLKSPKDTARIIIQPKDVRYLVLQNKLQNKLIYAPILLDDLRGDKHLCRKVTKGIFFSHAFHGVLPYYEQDTNLICGLLNSSLSWFLIENLGRRGLGGGAIRLTTNDIKKIPLIVKKEKISEKTKKKISSAFLNLGKREISDVFNEMGLDSSKPIREQEPKPISDRAELDKIVFDELGLTKEERKEVYWVVCEMVKQRLEKAKSLDN
jgi:hypothetical protein